MDKRECFYLGYTSKVTGLKGHIQAVFDVDDAKKYNELDALFIEINQGLVPFFITEIKIQQKGASILLDGIDNSIKAKELIGKSIYLPLTNLPKLKNNEFYHHEIIGYTVIDTKAGEIGTIKEVLEYPQQAIFQIMQGSKEILIPAKKEFIEKIIHDKKIIEVTTPDGLLDIYLSENNDTNEEE